MKIIILSGNDPEALVENERISHELLRWDCDVDVLNYQQSSILDSNPDTGIQIVSGGEIVQTIKNYFFSLSPNAGSSLDAKPTRSVPRSLILSMVALGIRNPAFDTSTVVSNAA